MKIGQLQATHIRWLTKEAFSKLVELAYEAEVPIIHSGSYARRDGTGYPDHHLILACDQPTAENLIRKAKGLG